MASIRERIDADGKSKWHVQVRLLGFPPQTKTFARKSDAKDWAEETERLMKGGRFHAAAQNRTVADLFEVFRRDYMRETRQKDYTQILSWWEARIGRYHLANLRASTIQKYLEELKTAPMRLAVEGQNRDQGAVEQTIPAPAIKTRSTGTVLRYLAVLSRAMSVAVKNLEWLDRSPVAGVQRPVSDMVAIVRTLSIPDERTLLAEAAKSENKYLRTIIIIAVRTGMRLSEIMNLRWGDFQDHGDDALVTVRKAKNNRQRVVAVVRDARLAVRELRDKAVRELQEKSLPLLPESLLFPSADDPDKPVKIRKAWDTCVRRAGVTNFRFHDLRHTCASRLASTGHTLAEIAEMLGHTDLRSTQIYTHFAKGHTVTMAQRAADWALLGDEHQGTAKDTPGSV